MESNDLEKTGCACENSDCDGPEAEANAGGGGKALFACVALGLVVWWGIYHWLTPISEFLAYRVLPLSHGTRLGEGVAFFLFEVPKVLMLLVLVVFGIGIIRSFFTPERTKRILAGKRESVGNVLAAGLGVVTPFCSCSACPPVHRICRDRYTARRDILFPHLRPYGQRSGSGVAA